MTEALSTAKTPEDLERELYRDRLYRKVVAGRFSSKKPGQICIEDSDDFGVVVENFLKFSEGRVQLFVPDVRASLGDVSPVIFAALDFLHKPGAHLEMNFLAPNADRLFAARKTELVRAVIDGVPKGRANAQTKFLEEWPAGGHSLLLNNGINYAMFDPKKSETSLAELGADPDTVYGMQEGFSGLSVLRHEIY